MTLRQKIIVAIAGCHVAMVVYHGFLPVFELPAPSRTHPIGLAVNTYGAMTGANNTYGFFKFIGGTCRVRFQMADEQGNFWTDVLSRADNREAEMRFRLTSFQLGEYGDARDVLAAHWAATMFARHPTAVQVIVRLEQYQPPSMADYRDGVRTDWTETYQQFFWKHDQLFPAQEGVMP